MRIICLLIVATSSYAATYTAASCSVTDIQTALNNETSHAADGDIISLPSCNTTWTGSTTITVNFTTNVTVQGAGAISSTTGGVSTTGSDSTLIVDNLTTSGPGWQINTVSGKSLRVTAMSIQGSSSSTATGSGMLAIGGSSTTVRIDHCHFFVPGEINVGVSIQGALQGVADHNYFNSNVNDLTFDFELRNGQNWNGDTFGFADKSWADTDHWGTSQFFFIEDSRFVDGGVWDTNEGARAVFRYNTITGVSSSGTKAAQMYNHGIVDARAMGLRAAEVYNNNFSYPGNSSNPAMSPNSGIVLFWGNTVTGGYGYALAVSYDFRTTAGGGGNYNYTGNWGYCGTAAGGPTNWDGNLNSSGYPCLGQPGRSAGDLITGGSDPPNFSGTVNSTTVTVAWPHEKLDPYYVWGNTFTPTYYTTSPLVSETTGGSGASIFSDNREYYQQFGSNAEPGSFNGTRGVGQGLLSARTSTCTAGTDPVTSTVAPGVGYFATDNSTLYVCTATNTWTAYYTPYTYPHPLTQSIAIAGTVIGGKNQITGKTVIQ